MSQLTLTKRYGDTQLLFKADIEDMWDELEAFVNGNLTRDNITGVGNIKDTTLNLDESYYFGTTSSAYIRFEDSSNDWLFVNTEDGSEIIFKVNSTEVARIDTDRNLTVKSHVFFPTDTDFSLTRFLGMYTKPVLVYVDSNTIDIENNNETDSGTLVVFPEGPVEVIEDVSATHKFRRLKLNATANGYATSHTGNADSGLRSGLTLAANTWYFVYAVMVQGGNDVGEFVLVVDDTSPAYSNHSTLDSRYTSGKWVYIGAIRIGHGDAQTTTLIPFIQDHTGWTYFTGRGSTDDFLGYRVHNAEIETEFPAFGNPMQTVHSYDTGNSGEAVPSIMSAIMSQWRASASVEDDMGGVLRIGVGSYSSIFWQLPSFGINFEGTSEPHGGHFKIANTGELDLFAAMSTTTDSYDYTLRAYISGFLDEFV